MVSYPSLQNISYVEGTGGTECEMSGMLMCQLPPRVADLVSSYPACHQTQKQSEMRSAGLKTDAASLFLPREGGAGVVSEGSVSSVISLLLHGGLEGVINNISGVAGQGWVKLWRILWSFQSSIYPHLKMSTLDMISDHSNTRNWSQSHIKCISWHPHAAKLAVAYNDDSISIVSVDNCITNQPVLKHASMKNITSMRWRPLNSSHLAVACQMGVAVWTVDPTSLVSRPSSSCLVKLCSTGHTPVTEVQWSPCGRLLASGSPADTRIHVWCVETEQSDKVSRYSGGGVTCLRWSQDTKKLFCGSPGTVFRVWNTETWTCDKWNVGGATGRVAAASWAPDSSHLLFATTEEPVLYCVSFLGEGESAVPLMDLSKVCLDNGDVGGGLVQDIQWDPTGHRIAVTFKETNSICLLRSKPRHARLSPVGWVTGADQSEYPVCIQFQQSSVEFGAVLTVVWSRDRVQHLPLVFNVKEDLMTELPDSHVEELFTSYGTK